MSETPDPAAPEGAELEAAVDAASEAVAVQAQELQELAGGATGDEVGLSNLMDLPVRVTVEVGRTRMRLADLVHLAPGSLLELDRDAHEPADILVNGKVVARGEIVTIDNSYGVRITDVEK